MMIMMLEGKVDRNISEEDFEGLTTSIMSFPNSTLSPVLGYTIFL